MDSEKKNTHFTFNVECIGFYRAGCGPNAYCEPGFDKLTGEERPVCLCNPGYVGMRSVQYGYKNILQSGDGYIKYQIIRRDMVVPKVKK
jgi:hypothetical protein